VSDSASPEERKKRIQELLVRAYRQNLRPVDLDLYPPEPDALPRLPLDLIQRYRIVPLRVATLGGRQVLAVAACAPLSEETIQALRSAAGLLVLPLLALPEQVDAAIRRCCEP
jgi:hypothetical protein